MRFEVHLVVRMVPVKYMLDGDALTVPLLKLGAFRWEGGNVDTSAFGQSSLYIQAASRSLK